MHRNIARWAAPAVLGMVVVLAGCSGAEAPDADERVSPLGEYFSAFYGGDLDPEDQEAKFAADQKEREELISQCMQEEGFEYIPVDASATTFSSGDEWKPDDREWVAQWGYGAVEYPGQDEQQDPEDVVPDPNADYVSSLSESERTAFYEALYGPSPTEEEMSEDGSYEYSWETSGCQGWADHEINGEDPLQSDEFSDVMDAMTAFYETVPTLPEMVDLDAKWSECMDAAGYPGFATQTDAQNSIYDELNALWTDETGETGPDPAAMDAIHEKEVELALADLDCREDTDYRDAAEKISWKAEEQFIADHKAELDAMKAAAEQARS